MMRKAIATTAMIGSKPTMEPRSAIVSGDGRGRTSDNVCAAMVLIWRAARCATSRKNKHRFIRRAYNCLTPYPQPPPRLLRDRLHQRGRVRVAAERRRLFGKQERHLPVAGVLQRRRHAH